MKKKEMLTKKMRELFEEVVIYWKQPRPGEYVCYKELTMLSLGWLFQFFAVNFTIGFGVGNVFTGATLGMNNNELLIMGYVCQIIGYFIVPLNSWMIDNLRSKHGKYRVYIRLAVPSMILTLISLWLPYEEMRDGVSRYLMIAVLFVMCQVQGYVQNWFKTGLQNMVHVITPNSQERAKIMSIVAIVYSFAPTVMNIYLPLMVDILPINANKYTMTYYRGTFTPLALFAPLALIAFYGTKERIVLPKSRITRMSFGNSIRSVAGNRIFWIKCFDAWNNFLEDAKGNVWDMLVYRAHITSSTTYGIMNTICHNSQLWAMMLAPWFIKKLGKKNMKIISNAAQVLLVASIRFTYKSKYAMLWLFVINYINRFLSCAEVINNAIESDMRDTQQYLTGERIDGAFGFVSSYANGAVGMATGLFLPWVYGKCGFDGNDYSVLDVYIDYNPDLPLSQQQKNPKCVLYSMLDVLIAISTFGALVDVIPWFFYDVTETGQKSMIRVIRLRTLVEDSGSEDADITNYLEGCEAVFNSRKYENHDKKELPKKELKAARALPRNTPEESAMRTETVKKCKKAIEETRVYNEEIEISSFVLFEMRRFETEFGKKQLELAKFIASGGEEKFYENYEKAVEMARNLPMSKVKEEKIWRKQEIRNARALRRSAKKAFKYYKDGKISFDDKIVDDAYNLPDDTKENQKIRTKAMRAANKEQNRYASVSYPYLSALSTIKLAEGYKNIDALMSDYDEIKKQVEDKKEQEYNELKQIADERLLDIERKRAQRKMRRK